MVGQLHHDVVKIRVVAVRFDDEGLEVVRQDHLGQPAEESQRLIDTVDEVGRTLARKRDGKSVL